MVCAVIYEPVFATKRELTGQIREFANFFRIPCRGTAYLQGLFEQIPDEIRTGIAVSPTGIGQRGRDCTYGAGRLLQEPGRLRMSEIGFRPLKAERQSACLSSRVRLRGHIALTLRKLRLMGVDPMGSSDLNRAASHCQSIWSTGCSAAEFCPLVVREGLRKGTSAMNALI